MCNTSEQDIPVISLSDYETDDDPALVESVAKACSEYGFFHLAGHGIAPQLIEQLRTKAFRYFQEVPLEQKKLRKRTASNARGFFDDEYTKRKLDWKQAVDLGVPASRDWSLPDDCDSNRRGLDGVNQFPDEDEAPGFRDSFTSYFDACSVTADRVARIMARGIMSGSRSSSFLDDLKREHTSYLRLNYYPPTDQDPAPLGISPHKDAGFLTLLLADEDCHSLQVWLPRNLMDRDADDAAYHWHTVRPVPGCLVVNTGDMAQLWSNGRYQAVLHRVLSHATQQRLSAPFFYNPPYHTWMRPVVTCSQQDAEQVEKKGTLDARYHPVLWGYFRAVRFAGDWTDLGVEIQLDDFQIGSGSVSDHLSRQERFAAEIPMDRPFDVEAFREWFVNEK
jgi:isopenicillin N synthase-like dioxygenase